MGILGISMNVGASMFPPIGSYISMKYSMDIAFYISSLLALVSIGILLGLKETLENPQKFKPSLLKISKHEINIRYIKCIINGNSLNNGTNKNATIGLVETFPDHRP